MRSVLCRLSLSIPTLIALSAAGPALGDYPIMSHRYLADPGAAVYKGRVYLYLSNDDDNKGTNQYLMKSIVCVSSSDMKNWTDHGIVFQVPADASWASYSWAPVPLVRDDKFYLYFGNNASGVGVATSTSPIGPFKDPINKYLVNANTPGAKGSAGGWFFDPGALIDDDGKAYLSFGGNGADNGRIIQLGNDLISVTGSAVGGLTTGSTNTWFEASYMFKRKGIYYMTYSTNGSNGQRMDYFMSQTGPMSGYTYAGVLADQPTQNGNNNHSAEFEFNGRWYHAYHNRAVAKAAGIDATCSRNLALEVLDFDDTGKVVRITSAKYTTDGVPQVGTLNPYVRVEAETMNAQKGIETETSSSGGMNVTDISAGDWIRVRGVDFGTAGAKTFTAQVAAAAAGGSIELRSGSDTGTLLGTCAVPATGGATTWKAVTCDVSGATGVVKDLFLKFVGGNFKFDYWQFTGSGTGTGGTGGTSATGGTTSMGGTATRGGSTSSGGTSSRGGSTSTSGTSSIASGGVTPSSGGTSGDGGAASIASGGLGTTIGGGNGVGGAPATTAVTGSTSTTAAGALSTGGGPVSSAGGGTTSAGNTAVTTVAGDAGADEGGCSCRLAESRASSNGWLALGSLACAGLFSRRRRRFAS